ncbi:sensor histidine kinase [Lysinibacter cavernae]|uniref:histidine kinase n=1 Tax=Lysinibacter cavernae TaxID=1640652 RepID=A0A7X5QYR6_9MICO|nr:histidine kinase [Lysinibacter cavernae]NIH52453.1 signal transduction histidine kinase [Lysinibacter cavernae]
MNLTRAKRTLLDIGVGVIGVLVFWVPFGESTPSGTGFRLALLAAVAIGLILREWMPVLGFALVLLATVVGTTAGLTSDPFVLAAWSLYPLATTYGSIKPFRVVLGLLVLFVFLGSVAVVPGTEETIRNGLFSFIVLAGSWALGSGARRSRREQAHTALVEQEQAVTAERLHVAREVHDVLSHSLASIAVTSSVATHRAGHLSHGELTSRLARIEATSQEALRDLKTVLGGIRSERGDHSATRRQTPADVRANDLTGLPQPTLDDIHALVGRATASGLAAELRVNGSARYSPTTELAVFRVVQEGLTNVAKHAPSSECRVTVSAATDAVTVSVENSAPVHFQQVHSAPVHSPQPAAAGTPALGFGLRGLNERITQLGGAFTSGPTGAGGFCISATLPAHPLAAPQGSTESSTA